MTPRTPDNSQMPQAWRDPSNAHDPAHDIPDLPDPLRWQLRALRQEQAPSADLWSGVAARLVERADVTGTAPFALPAMPTRSALSAQRPLPTAGSGRLHRSRMPVALAASMLVAVGTLGLLRHGGPSMEGQPQVAPLLADTADTLRSPAANEDAGGYAAQHVTAGTPLALAEAEGLRLQYEGAIRELEALPGTAMPNATLRTLDHSAALILAALRQAPDSMRLLEQLRRTYQRRLDLMRLPLA